MNSADEREEGLFREALQRAVGPEREAYLDQACAGGRGAAGVPPVVARRAKARQALALG